MKSDRKIKNGGRSNQMSPLRNTAGVGYSVYPDGFIGVQPVGFEIDNDVLSVLESDVDASREYAKREEALVALFKPKTSAKRAVKALRRLAAEIEQEGLIKGYTDGGLEVEHVQGHRSLKKYT